LGTVQDRRYGKNEPDVFGNNVGSYKVNLPGGVRLPFGRAESADIRTLSVSAERRGLDLDSHKLPGVFNDEIVTAGVSPRLADEKSLLGCAGHEAQFRPFSALFALFDTCPIFLHEDLHSNKKRGPKRSRAVKIHYISSIAGCRGRLRHSARNYIRNGVNDLQGSCTS